MIRNYLKTAFRSLRKNKGFTFLNIFGLALGLAICLLIVFYVKDELSFDRYNTQSGRIVRVNTEFKYHGLVSSYASAPAPLAATLMASFPEVEKAVRLTPALNLRFKKGNESLAENRTFYADPGIFDVFTLPMLSGNPKTALTEPGSMVISESIAKKYFNRSSVVGQTMTLSDDSSAHKIVGVMRDMPAQSHFRADFFIAMNPVQNNNWNSISSLHTYVLLRPGTNYKSLEAQTAVLIKKKLAAAFDYTQFEAKGNYLRLSMIPLTDIHLRSNRMGEFGPNGNIDYIYIFSAIAGFILLLACINFTNLSTARFAGRAREVGVRKVLGSGRKHLIFQFLSESVMVTLAAVAIAAAGAWILLPLFNQLSGKDLAITGQTLKWLLPSLLILALAVGILAGSYPAFFLSAFEPVHVLKGSLSTGFKSSILRNFLVILQFSIAIFLIIGTLVIYSQLAFIQNKDLGFNRNQVLIVKNAQALRDPQTLKREIKQLPGVLDATLTSFLPTGGVLRFPNFFSASTGKNLQAECWTVDEDYLNTMGMTLSAGRNFSRQLPTDSSAFVVNEAAARLFAYKDDPNEKIKYAGKDFHIIGVVKDFNFNSLRENITPVVMILRPDWMASLSIKIQADHLAGTMTAIQRTWKQLAPNEHFEYSFMDEDFDAIYRSETRMGKLFIIFTTLAIAIACLGLFGLAAYAAEQRTREIGIRKVLGASVTTITAMLSMDFIRLVILAILIATPLSWWAMTKWLEGFAYHQNIPWWMMAYAALGSVLIALVTISFQSIKAAIQNPVESLRSA